MQKTKNSSLLNNNKEKKRLGSWNYKDQIQICLSSFVTLGKLYTLYSVSSYGKLEYTHNAVRGGVVELVMYESFRRE